MIILSFILSFDKASIYDKLMFVEISFWSTRYLTIVGWKIILRKMPSRQFAALFGEGTRIIFNLIPIFSQCAALKHNSK